MRLLREPGDVPQPELDHLAVGDDDGFRRLHPGRLREPEQDGSDLGVLLARVVEVVVLDDVVSLFAIHEPPLVADIGGGERHHVPGAVGRVEQLRAADDHAPRVATTLTPTLVWSPMMSSSDVDHPHGLRRDGEPLVRLGTRTPARWPG